MATAPCMSQSETIALLLLLIHSLAHWRNSETVHSSGHIREIAFNEHWRLDQAGTSQFLWINEFQEIVGMPHKDTNDGEDASRRQNQIHSQQNPWQVHCLKPGAEPEIHDNVLVQFAPNVQHR